MIPPEEPPRLPEANPDPDPFDEVIELVPLDEPVPVVWPARPVQRPTPPRPGLWQSIAWCFALLASLYVPLVIAGGLTFAVMAIASGDIREFWKAESRQMQKVADQRKPKAADEAVPMPDGISYSLAVGMLAGHVGSLTLALLLLRFGVGPDWKRKVALRRPPLIPLFLSLVVLPGLMLVHSAVHTGLHEVVEGTIRAINPKVDVESGSMDAQLKAMLAPWPVWLAVLIIGVGPGVIEELFCRGYLGRGLVARYGPVSGVLLTSVLFGMLHVAPLYALGTMVMGVLLHVIYLATRSLWVPILLHFLNNTLTILTVLGVLKVRGLEADPTELSAFVYLFGLTLTASGIWALWSARGRLVTVDVELLAWKPEYPGVELPRSDSGTVVQHRSPNPIAVALTLTSLIGLLYFLA
jgi:membrane protease YdiL (CAAX protease family)